MGFDFHVARRVDFCEHCGRYKDNEMFWFGRNLFIDNGDIIVIKDGMETVSHTTPIEEFSKHIDNGTNYTGIDAVNRWEAVKRLIKPKYYKMILGCLKQKDVYMYAWW